MIYVLFMAIVCAIAVGQSDAATGSDVSFVFALLATVACALGPIIVALMSVAICRHSQLKSTAFNKRSTWLMRLHSAAWLASALGCVYWANWPAVIRNSAIGNWILIDELLMILPLLASWLVSWSVFYAWYAHETPALGRARFVWQQCRLTLLLAWMPVLMFCAIHDTISAIFPSFGETQTSLFVFVINLTALIVFFPRLLGWIWETKPLPHGPLRDRLTRMAQQNGLVVREIHVWQTDLRIANAAVAGVVPSTRRVFLSDVLVQFFSDDEIEAAFAHELGHARHHHSLFRMALLLVPLSVCLVVSAIDPTSTFAIEQDLSLLSILGVSAYLIIGLGWYSRRLEHEADLWACKQLALEHGTAAALQRYVGLLFRLCDQRHVNRGSWLHPGHKHRRRFLIGCLSNLRRADAFQREMKWLAALLIATAILPLVLLVAT